MLMDSGQQLDSRNDGLSTPSRMQKCLFLLSSNSSKRSLFREKKELRKDIESVSDAESDLGPMSPLALTDHSSCDSSPGRQFVSPLATPDKSPMISLSKGNSSKPGSARNDSNEPISPFSSLRRVTRSARFSPRRIFPLSSKSSQSNQNLQAESTSTSPDFTDKTLTPEDVIPETPVKESDFDDQHSYVAETPQKEEYLEQRLNTPLGSVCKRIPIPRIHRRKSSGASEFDQCSSPEIKKSTVKRHLDNYLLLSNAKRQKADELSSAPRARAALFQENNKTVTEKEKGFTLNPKSFYGSNDKTRKSVGLQWREPQPDFKKRRSLPSHSSTYRRSGKRPQKGEINFGVSHGIKRPKVKRQSPQNNSTKAEKQGNNPNNKSNDSKENLNPRAESTNNNQNKEPLSEVTDPSKKFFKSKPGHNAVVTVDDKIKSRVVANPSDADHINKKRRLNEISLDAADLTVEEPTAEVSLVQNKVDDILKILEDDWADDACDDMETAQTACSRINISPKKSVALKDLTMSPASELSSMASTMNIEDISLSTDNLTCDNPNNVSTSGIPSQKFYPLFTKGHPSDVPNEDSISKKRKRTTAWQLSSKHHSAENQYQIDAGQKLFGATQCNECGIIYHIGDPDDENAHLNYHNSFKTLKFQGWKNERVIYNDSCTSSRIILLEPKDSNSYWKKITEVLQVVDRELGLTDPKLASYRDKRVYMYVRDKTILGVLVAEEAKSAFQMIPELFELNCCTAEATSVKCGVNVVWTVMSHRRQGIATKLVDILRSSYYYGYIMSIEDIAFSTPTPSGRQFAEKYTKTRNFKVY